MTLGTSHAPNLSLPIYKMVVTVPALPTAFFVRTVEDCACERAFKLKAELMLSADRTWEKLVIGSF